MEQPIKYNSFTEEQKNEFVVLSYLGYTVTRVNGRFVYITGSCPTTMWGTEEETYLKIVKSLICFYETMSKFRVTKSWDKLIPVIIKLRSEKNYTEKYKNQIKNIDYWLNHLNIDMVSRYVAGAINVLNGKKGVRLTIN